MGIVYEIEKLGMSIEEVESLSKLSQNKIDFIIGLKRLSRDTGVHVASFDFSSAAIISDETAGVSIPSREGKDSLVGFIDENLVFRQTEFSE